MSNIKDRKDFIGGSDISCILGINPYKTAYELYEEKITGEQEDISDKPAVTWGNNLEAAVANHYAKENGIVLVEGGFHAHPQYPFLCASPDRLILNNSQKGLEVKTASYHSRDAWGEPGTQVIPHHYYAQIAHYMLVLGYEYWDLAVLIGGQDYRVYSFERDREIDSIIIEQANDFWNNHVLAKVPPSIDLTSDRAKDIVKKKFKLVSEEETEIELEIADAYTGIRKILDNAQKEKTRLEAEILAKMGNCGAGKLSDGRKFIRKQVNRKGYTVADSNYITLSLTSLKNWANLKEE